ncbi:helix-turn-helix domain-containing protein [Coprococcus comes]|uniref:helix-turn-helix domain-containing protein n=1 Tax=Coprococcus comes TaxID=410072 RepID=UPI001C0252D4|nr:helix-turn-helix transcriptional regulator [Coprococcus comes]MBT9780968.1 helix-turn-helix domain-containing protein [Coprococcus comes]
MYGSRIREMRKRRGLTLKEVAEATGYTIGHISQIERDLKSPSLVALRKIAACLNCSEVWLIMDDSELSAKSSEEGKKSKESYLMRKENRIPMKIPEIDVSYSIFTPSKLPNAQEAQMTGLIVRLKPNTWVTEKMISHGNYDESLLLLKGELELRIDNSTYMIYEGDSFYIPKNCLHNYLNTSDEEATIIVYFSQLVY